MNISKKSWHYQLLLVLGMRPTEFGRLSLCQYVRRVLLSFLIILALIFLNACVASVVVWFFTGVFNGFVGIGLGMITIATFVGLVYWDVEYNNEGLSKFVERLWPRLDEDNILRSWFSAVHNKVCPRVDFIERK